MSEAELAARLTALVRKIDLGNQFAADELVGLIRQADPAVADRASRYFSAYLPVAARISHIQRNWLDVGNEAIIQGCLAGREVGLHVDYRLSASLEPKVKRRMDSLRAYSRALVRKYLIPESARA
jgi:hypothetical protein